MSSSENGNLGELGMILSLAPTRHQYFASLGGWRTLEFRNIIVLYHQQVTCGVMYHMSWQDT